MRDQTIDLPLEFDELVRDALLHLYDLARLQTHRLITWMDTDEPRTTAPRGKLVRQVLLDAIASLYPGSGIEASSPAWRAYRLLELRYLEDRPVTDVMKQMALRKTQYHREHQRALHAVSSVLWDRWQVAARWSTTPVGNQMGESASGSDVARREAAALLANQGSQCADPVQVCHEVSQLLEPLGRERGVQIYVVPKDHVPAIEGNRVALRHALLTILTRAVELPGAGVVRIELECKDEQVLIWLSGSTGRPILPTDLGVGESRVFVEAMRGRLHCFAAPQQPGQWGVSLSFSAKARRTLLVVDNDVDFIRLMQRYLAGYSWDVIGASSVDQALGLVQSAGPYAILLDVVMPGRDGWDALLALRAGAMTRGVPVIVCSAFEEPQIATSLGALAALRKPVSQQQLLALLSSFD